MNGSEFKAIRKGSRLTVLQWARALGYQGSVKTVREQIAKYDRGARPIPPWISKLATMYRRFGVPDDMIDRKDSQMTPEQFHKLKSGDIVQAKGSRLTYTVTVNYGSRATAIRTVDLASPDDWILASKAVYKADVDL